MEPAVLPILSTDRRSRLSLRGRGPFSVGSSTSGAPQFEQSLRCRLTRSVSSATSSCSAQRASGCYCCDRCRGTVVRDLSWNANYAPPYRQSLDGLRAPDGASSISQDSPFFLNRPTVPSGISPFTSSAGLLYSTLPTKYEFHFNGTSDQRSLDQHFRQSTGLRRSCGAGLSRLDHTDFQTAPVSNVAATQPATSTSRSSIGSIATGNSDRHQLNNHHCCLHRYGALFHTPSSNQMRLYRRLYSLIDHPCISLFHSSSSRYLTRAQTHSSHMSQRHSLSLRNRHTVTPSSPFQWDNSIRSSMPTGTPYPSNQLPSDLINVPFGLMSDEGNSGTPFSPSGVAEKRRWLMNNSQRGGDCGGGGGPGLGSSVQRCRRNSDPECWQLQQSRCEGSDLDMLLQQQEQIEQEQQQLQQQSRWAATPTRPAYLNRQSGISPRPPEQFASGSGRQFIPSNSVFSDVQRAASSTMGVGGGGCAQQVDSYKTSVFYPDNDRIPNTWTNVFSSPAPSSSSSTTTQSNEPGLSRATAPQPYFPFGDRPKPTDPGITFRPSFLSPVVCTPDCPSSATSDFAQTPTNTPLASSKLIPPSAVAASAFLAAQQPWATSTSAAAVGPASGDQSQNTLNSATESLQRELAALDQTDPNASGPTKQPATDVSVNDLAAYMEHMVHIPGRMSEMAQRMYL